MAREQINVRLPEAVVEAMDSYAETYGSTRTSVVEEAVRAYVGMNGGGEEPRWGAWELQGEVHALGERVKRLEQMAERAGAA